MFWLFNEDHQGGQAILVNLGRKKSGRDGNGTNMNRL
jgi:hypothetical protein